MPITFEIQRIAIHLVDKKDKKQKEPRYSKAEVKLGSYPQNQQGVIRSFLTGHIQNAWGAGESTKTRSANFQEPSSVHGFYEQLRGNGDEFFTVSKTLARNLYDLSPSTASRGLLLVLWFTVSDIPHEFLGLFKLDPGRRDQIALDQTLLELAVRSIEEALPEPGDRVLKWALIPHPPSVEGTPSPFELKLRDIQQRGDGLAAYFEQFLGCVARPNVKQEIGAAFQVIEEYAKDHHPEQQDWQRNLEPFVWGLSKGKEAVTPEILADEVEKAALFTGFDRPALQTKLKESNAKAMNVAPARFRQVNIHYYLEPSKIEIFGPVEAMEDKQQVREVPVAGGREIRIFTTRLRKKVEL